MHEFVASVKQLKSQRFLMDVSNLPRAWPTDQAPQQSTESSLIARYKIWAPTEVLSPVGSLRFWQKAKQRWLFAAPCIG